MAKRNFVITVVLMLFIVASTGFAADNYQWKLVDSKDGCQTYTSPVPGKDIIAAKATCMIPAKIEVIGVMLRDIESYPLWMQDCVATKILKVVDEANDVILLWFHQHIDVLKDRDMVLKSRAIVDMEHGHNVVIAESTNDTSYDSGKGYIRMPSFKSIFELEWVDREHTRVTFTIDPDLGSMPFGTTGIANSTIKSLPFKTLKNMMKAATLPKYVEPAKTSKYNKFAEDYVKAGHK